MRKKILENRKAINDKELNEKSQKIINHLYETDFYKEAKCIMAYIDFRNEVKTEEFIKKTLSENKKVIIPISVPKTRELILSELRDFDNELIKGTYGILEPKEDFIRKTDFNNIDLVLVPGVAFDKRGFRIGYGAGYYDRFLSKLDESVPKVALAFDLQMVPKVEEGPYDIAVDYIITESGIIECK